MNRSCSVLGACAFPNCDCPLRPESETPKVDMTEVSLECSGPFSDAKDCPVHKSDLAAAPVTSCGHNERFKDVFNLPREDNGCLACALERTTMALSLAQTEIKGHMRVQDELKARIAELEDTRTTLKSQMDDWLSENHKTLAARDNAIARADEAQARIAELEKDAVRYQTKKHIDCLKFMETSGYKICKDTDSLLIAWSMSYDAAIDAALKDRA